MHRVCSRPWSSSCNERVWISKNISGQEQHHPRALSRFFSRCMGEGDCISFRRLIASLRRCAEAAIKSAQSSRKLEFEIP